MTITELNQSVPTLVGIFTDYLTSIYFIGGVGIVILVSIIIHPTESKYRKKNPFKLSSIKEYIKEYWLVMLLFLLIFNTIMFTYNFTVTRTSWEDDQLQAYMDEQETIVEENILLKKITVYEDKLSKGQAIILIDGKLEKIDVNIKYKEGIKEPQLTYVVLDVDIKYLTQKPLYIKGEKVNQTLVIPHEYNDKLVPIEYIDNQE